MFTSAPTEFSIRWHSRAGQGGVTAANFVGEALAKLGYHSLSFPDYGAEKRGAPVVVFNRFSKEKNCCDPAHLTRVDIVILLDPTLIGAELEYDDILQGLDAEGLLLINTAREKPSKFSDRHKTVQHVPATTIALETVKRNVPNVAMVGALTHALSLDKDEMERILREHLAGFFPPEIVEKNMVGYERGYAEIFTPTS